MPAMWTDPIRQRPTVDLLQWRAVYATLRLTAEATAQQAEADDYDDLIHRISIELWRRQFAA